MTISATGRRYKYTGNGVTVDFAFPRPFLLNTDLKVYLITTASQLAVLQVYATNYTVAGAGLDAGGTVTMLVAPSALQSLVIIGDTDATQNLALGAVTSWPMTSVEYAFDRLTIFTQEIWDRLTRVPNAPRYRLDDAFDYTLPVPTATYQLAVNSAGTGFEYRASTGSTWIVAAGVPGVGTGATGDMYINSTTGDVYGPKTSVWGGIVVNIKGPTGAPGTMTGPGISVDNEVVLFNGVSGSAVKSAGVLFSKLARLDAANVHTAGKQTYFASALAGASINIPAGAAPSAPVDGDMWTTTARVFARLNGVTETLAHLSANIFTAIQIFLAGTTGQASINIPSGVAPTSPNNGDIWSTTTKLLMRLNGVSETFAFLSAQTFTALQTFFTATTGSASINIPHGTDPTSPNNGDIWTTTGGIKARINGVTQTLGSGGGLTVIHKATADSRAGGGALTNDTDFVIALAANTNYDITIIYKVSNTGSAATGFKIGLSGPAIGAGSVMFMAGMIANSGANTFTNTAFTAVATGNITFTQTGTANNDYVIMCKINWRNGANAGNLNIQTARPGAGTASFDIGSILEYQTYA